MLRVAKCCDTITCNNPALIIMSSVSISFSSIVDTQDVTAWVACPKHSAAFTHIAIGVVAEGNVGGPPAGIVGFERTRAELQKVSVAWPKAGGRAVSSAYTCSTSARTHWNKPKADDSLLQSTFLFWERKEIRQRRNRKRERKRKAIAGCQPQFFFFFFFEICRYLNTSWMRLKHVNLKKKKKKKDDG